MYVETKGNFVSKLYHGDNSHDTIEPIGSLQEYSQINFLGDSITEGALDGNYTFADTNTPYWVNKLTGVPTVNYGISGTRISCDNQAGKSMWSRMLKIDFKPNDITILAGGANDTPSGMNQKHFQKAVELCIFNWLSKRKKGSKLVVCTVLPIGATQYYADLCFTNTKYSDFPKYSKSIRNAVWNYRLYPVKLLDLETAALMGLIPNAMNPQDNYMYYGNNALHPNYNGYKKIGRFYAEFLLKTFGKMY